MPGCDSQAHLATPAYPPPGATRPSATRQSKAHHTHPINPYPLHHPLPFSVVPCNDPLHKGKHVWGHKSVCPPAPPARPNNGPRTRPCTTHFMITAPSPLVFHWACYMHANSASCIRQAHARGMIMQVSEAGPGAPSGTRSTSRPPGHAPPSPSIHAHPSHSPEHPSVCTIYPYRALPKRGRRVGGRVVPTRQPPAHPASPGHPPPKWHLHLPLLSTPFWPSITMLQLLSTLHTSMTTAASVVHTSPPAPPTRPGATAAATLTTNHPLPCPHITNLNFSPQLERRVLLPLYVPVTLRTMWPRHPSWHRTARHTDAASHAHQPPLPSPVIHQRPARYSCTPSCMDP